MSSMKILSKNDAVSILEVIQASLACAGEEDLKRIILGMEALLPFDFAICGLAVTNSVGSITSYMRINTSYPDDWLALYERERYLEIDPIVRENFTTFGLQYWADTYRNLGCPGHFIAVAEDHQLKQGYSFGMAGPGGNGGSLFSFSGKMPRHPRHELILNMTAPHLHQALLRVAACTEKKDTPVLSEREIEVLNWIRQGKNSWEISMILGISERTVKYHVSTVMGKLDASNRSHAVAIAMSMGLIAVD